LSFASLLCGSIGHKSCRATLRRKARWQRPLPVRARVCEHGQNETRKHGLATDAPLTFRASCDRRGAGREEYFHGGC